MKHPILKVVVPAATRLAALALGITLAGCATRPPLDPTGVAVDLAPWRAAESTAHDETEVIWGGMIVEVTNRADRTEIEVVAYPLDSAQRPLVRERTQGRFIAVLPGYVEAFDYPRGRFVSFRGRVFGTREATVGARVVPQSLLRVQTSHLWPAGFQHRGPQISFGIGVGIH